MRITGSHSSVSTSALIASAPSRFLRDEGARVAVAAEDDHPVAPESKSDCEIVRIGTGSATPGKAGALRDGADR